MLPIFVSVLAVIWVKLARIAMRIWRDLMENPAPSDLSFCWVD